MQIPYKQLNVNQSLLPSDLNPSYVNNANGFVVLDVDGKVSASNLPNSLMNFKGNWDADTNSPELLNTDTNVQGDTYRVSVAGTVDFGAGDISFEIGDWVYSNGTVWQKGDNTDQVASVFGRTGTVTAQTSDYDASQIDNDSSVVGLTVKDALETLDGDISAATHDPVSLNVDTVTQDTLNLSTQEIQVNAVTGTTYGAMIPGDKVKVDFITVTQSVDLDTMESDIAQNKNNPYVQDLTGEAVTKGNSWTTTLTTAPTTPSKTRLFINGVKQRYGTGNDFTITGSPAVTVNWLSTATGGNVSTQDVVEMYYEVY